jgi:hypothetical protein
MASSSVIDPDVEGAGNTIVTGEVSDSLPATRTDSSVSAHPQQNDAMAPNTATNAILTDGV